MSGIYFPPVKNKNKIEVHFDDVDKYQILKLKVFVSVYF